MLGIDRNHGWKSGASSTLLAAFSSVAIAACATSAPVTECRLGSDCDSGACRDGTCVEPGGSGGTGGDGGSGATSSGGGGTGTGAAASGGAGAGSGACEPNFDGTVARDEVVLDAGLTAKFLTATDVTFDTTGTMDQGERVWDLDIALTGDHTALIETMPLPGQWFEQSFPGATYAASLSDESDLLGVFEASESALLLRGVVSPVDDVFKTELVYDPPVTVMSFPLTEGKSWSSSTIVTGLAEGIFSTYTEAYEQTVDSRGTLRTPYGEFDVLRTRTQLTRTIGVLTTVVRSYAFTTECFGTVATLTSQDNEASVEFVDVAEVRRLTP